MSALLGYATRAAEALIGDTGKAVIKGALPEGVLRKLQGAKAASYSDYYNQQAYRERVKQEEEESAVAKGFDTITKGFTEASLFPSEGPDNPIFRDKEYKKDLTLPNGYLKVADTIKTIQQVRSIFEWHYTDYYTNLQILFANIEHPYFKILQERVDAIDVFALNAMLRERKATPIYEIELAKKSKFGHVYRQKYKSYDYLLLYFSTPLHIVFQDNGTFLPEYQEYIDLKKQMKQKGLTDIQVYNQGLLDAYVQREERLLEEQQRRSRLEAEERDRQYELQRQQAEMDRKERERVKQAKWNALSLKSQAFVTRANEVHQNLSTLLRNQIVIKFVDKFKDRKALGDYYLEGAVIITPYSPKYVQLQYENRFVLLMASFITVFKPVSLIHLLEEINKSKESIKEWTNFVSIASVVRPAEEYLYPSQIQQRRGGAMKTHKRTKKSRTKTHKL